MTSMEQIEYMVAQARKMGISWKEWRERFGHTLPKPQPSEMVMKEVDYAISERKQYKKRVMYEMRCRCGNKFTTSVPSRTDLCKECRKERNRIQARKRWNNT